jgi:TonB family protein
LTTVVIGLALLLGWMIGYAGWRKAASLRTEPAPNQASSKVIPDSSVELPPQLPKESPKRPRPTKGAATPPAPGGLVVYQNGKIVFEMPPGETTASKVRLAGGPGPVRLGPEVAARYLLRRVEAAYPVDTQGSQALGPVTLEIEVGKDGSVSQAALIRGDPSLASAAIAAARQWQFRPYAPDGTPMDFSTQITVNFSAK